MTGVAKFVDELRAIVLTGNWKSYRYVGNSPWYALTIDEGRGSAEMFG